MTENTKTLLYMGTGLAAYISVAYSTVKTLNEVDEIHEIETGEKIKVRKSLSNSVVGVTAGWAAALVSMLVVNGFRSGK